MSCREFPDYFDMDLGREEFEWAEGDRRTIGRSEERRRENEFDKESRGKAGTSGCCVMEAVVRTSRESSESILRRSSRFLRIWLKTRAISTLFRSFLPPRRSFRNLALNIDRWTVYHHREGITQPGELEFSHSRSIPRRNHKSSRKMVKLDELPPEIVDIIVQVGSSPQVAPESRYEDLKSFARIAPVFQDPSQRVMNERVVLKNGRSMQVWLQERKEGFVVKELELDLPGDSDGTMAQENLVERVIRACSASLKKLKVSGHHQFDRSILAEANLKKSVDVFVQFRLRR